MNPADQKKRCKALLNSGRGEITAQDDFDFLISVFQKHEAYVEKVGVGVRRILIKKTKYGTNCFFLFRLDESVTDISYIQCFRPLSNRQKIKHACRSVIRPEIEVFKATIVFGVDKCPISGEVLTKDNCHIDHYDLSFELLFSSWIDSVNITNVEKFLSHHGDGDTGYSFSSEYYSLSFLNYHNSNTHLRAVSKRANLSILKKGKW